MGSFPAIEALETEAGIEFMTGSLKLTPCFVLSLAINFLPAFTAFRMLVSAPLPVSVVYHIVNTLQCVRTLK
jgi:hypothetical protein